MQKTTLLKIGTPAAALLCLAIAGPIVLEAPAAVIDVHNANARPSVDHWLGTDQLGRDVLLRVLVATQLSIFLAVSATLISVVLGTLTGVGLSLAPPRLRTIGLRVIDALMAFPAILLAVILAAVLDPGAQTAVLAIGVAGAPGIARLTSNVSAAQLRMEHVQNARVVGVGDVRLFRNYLMPPVLRSLGITATYDIGLSLVAMASLSFLGLGVQLPDYDWGRLLADGIKQLNLNVWAAIAPAAAITIAGVFAAIVGESLSRYGARSGSTSPSGTNAAARKASRRASAGQQTSDRDGTVVSVQGLTVRYAQPGAEDPRPVLEDIDLEVGDGEIVGVIGESGSGKSTLASALSDLLPPAADWDASGLSVVGTDLVHADRSTIDQKLRSGVAVVFQDPMSSLNPAMSIRRQLGESLGTVSGHDGRRVRQRGLEALREVRIKLPELRMRQRPFELSGGMRQRVMIAMGLMANPRLLIADEPTTALDVTVQKEILTILTKIREEHRTSIILITHDIKLVASICDSVCVMRNGAIIERGSTNEILTNPQHGYTRELLDATVTLETEPPQRPTSTFEEIGR